MNSYCLAEETHGFFPFPFARFRRALLNDGCVVVLNGPSSAGKSTTAAAFQVLMPEPWWHTGMDTLSAMLPSDEGKRALCGVDRFVTVMHRFVADLAWQGHDVIYETGFLEPAWVEDFRRQTVGLRVFPVEFEIGLAEIRTRERSRLDRPDGYSEVSYDRVLRPFPWALRLDAERLDPPTRAHVVARYVAESSGRQTF